MMSTERWSHIYTPRLKLLFFLFFLNSNILYAHSGGLNGQGCHNNRKTGGYHCHRNPGWNTGKYPNRDSSSLNSSKSNNSSQKIKCKISIGNQYYKFTPSEIEKVALNFSGNSKKVILQCH